MTLFTKVLIAAPLVMLSLAGDSQAQFGRGGRGYGGGYGYGGYGGGYGYGGTGISYGTRVGNGFLSVGTGTGGYGYGGYGGGYGYGSPYYGSSYGSSYGNSYYPSSVYSSGGSYYPSASSTYAPATSFYQPGGTVMSGTVSGSTLQAMPTTSGVVQAGSTSPASAAGKYTVIVPENAKVWFNGNKNDQKGNRRDFTSTGSGQLTIKVEWKNGDQNMSKEVTVNVQDGEQSTLDLTPILQ